MERDGRTFWDEDDDPEKHVGYDMPDANDLALKMAGIDWLPGRNGERVEVIHDDLV